MSPRDPRDEQFEGYLEGGSALSRWYRQSTRDEPSPAVDEAVLAAARDAVARPRRTAPRLRPVSRRWLVPLSVAATVLLSVSLVTLIPGTVWRAPDPESARPAEADRWDSPSASARHPVEGVDDGPVARVGRALVTPEGKASARAAEDEKTGLATESEPAASYRDDAPAAPGQPPAGATSNDGPRRLTAKREYSRQGEMAPQDERAPLAKQREAGEPARSTGSPSAGTGGQGLDEERMLQDQARDQTVRRRAAIEASSLAAVRPHLETRRMRALDELEALLTGMQSIRGAADQERARARLATLRAQLVAIASQWGSLGDDGVEAAQVDGDEGASGQGRLREIERLLAQGHRREAEWQLARLRARHPEQRLSPELLRGLEP